MVARTKISPNLVVDQDSGRKSSGVPTSLDRKDSFTEYSSRSRRSESFDGSLSSSHSRAVIAPAPSAAIVRSRFLSRLGFSPPRPQPKTGPTKRARSDSRDSSESSFQALLKGDRESSSSLTRPLSLLEQGSSLSSVSSSDSDSSVGERRSVSFSPSVTVYPIPKHTAYSRRIRDTIWTTPVEMQETAARNCLEFAAENWDWRQVAEDQDMVYYHGERVHPVHFAHEYNIRRQFCAVMTAQSQPSL